MPRMLVVPKEVKFTPGKLLDAVKIVMKEPSTGRKIEIEMMPQDFSILRGMINDAQDEILKLVDKPVVTTAPTSQLRQRLEALVELTVPLTVRVEGGWVLRKSYPNVKPWREP